MQLLLTTGMMAARNTERRDATERGQNRGLRFQLYLNNTIILYGVEGIGCKWLLGSRLILIQKTIAIELTNDPIFLLWFLRQFPSVTPHSKIHKAALFGFISHSASRSHSVQRSDSQNWHSGLHYFPPIRGETGCKVLIKCCPCRSKRQRSGERRHFPPASTPPPPALVHLQWPPHPRGWNQHGGNPINMGE